MDHAAGVIPDSMNGSLIATTPSCIAVGTSSDCDEEVEIELATEEVDTDARMRCVCTTSLKTPNRELAVSTVLGETLLVIHVDDVVTHVEVWVNHGTEPSRVAVVARTVRSS